MGIEDLRASIHRGDFKGPTAGLAPGLIQANLIILPKQYAYDFLLFCVRNPKTCPILEVLNDGSYLTKLLAHKSDLRFSLPKYRVYQKDGSFSEHSDIKDFWRDDFVSFLLGCSFTFEDALMKSGIGMRHLEERHNIPMYTTNIKARSAGIFKAQTVVTMRPIPSSLVPKTYSITAKYPLMHGAPIHVGSPLKIGIASLDSPDFGSPSSIKDGELPVFWACGVSALNACLNAKLDFFITHSPGHMFISELVEGSLNEF